MSLTFPSAMYKRSSYFAISPTFGVINIYTYVYFYFSHFNRFVVVAHDSFNLYFLTINVVEHLFPSVCHPYLFFGDMSIGTFCSFSNWIVWFLTVEFRGLFINSVYESDM